MLIGGSLGSTAGGMKLLRLLILYRVLQLYFMRTAVPERAVLTPRLGAVALGNDDIRQSLILMTLFTLSLIVSWLAFLAYGYPAMDSLFEVSSALATTGLSTGISHESLPATLKLVLCLDMLLGRLEVFALLVLLYPRTWHERRPLRT
jgi:trk system potassium uptake protein TrkH